jgi:hypothetical protein
MYSGGILMLKRLTVISMVVLAGCLAGCASMAGDEPRETLPSYAAPLNNNMGWTVKCPLRTVSNPLNRNYEIFRNADGSTKSYEQFCEENDSSRRTNP